VKVLSIVGARPQFIKAAVVREALRRAGVADSLVHTGQHYDDVMSDRFFSELRIAPPDYYLGVGSGSHGDQTGRMMAALEPVVLEARPDRVLVYGDTNSTLAGAVVASKLRMPVDHVEAGLRSFDRDMPEEINRVLSDHLSDLLLCPTQTAVRNLEQEGIRDGVLHVGDVMLDLAGRMVDPALAVPLPDGLEDGAFFLATIHRASNTEEGSTLRRLVEALGAVAREVGPVLLPAHPRLSASVARLGIELAPIRAIDPVGYIAMQGLILRARGVLTDSGGVQKEAAFHGVPCITLRDTTEWPETVTAGLNVLVGDRLQDVVSMASQCAGRQAVLPRSLLDEFGNGTAGERIAEAVRCAGTSRRRWRARHAH
jgi:UDP-GlcNAc3NAcA epimerase